MSSRRPVGAFVEDSLRILQSEYVVIGQDRVSSFDAWLIIGFVAGITAATVLLASCSGTFESASAAATEYHWLEAENPTTLTAPMQVASDSAASGGKYIWVPNGAGTGGQATYAVNISQAGTYVLWARTIAPNGYDDSFYIEMDTTGNKLWHVPQSTTWTWRRLKDATSGADPVTWSLSAGTHTLKVKQREDGTKADKILITNDLSLVPSGVGGTAENVTIPKPDLVVTDIVFNPVTPKAGDMVTVSARIQNIGLGPVQPNTSIEVRIGAGGPTAKIVGTGSFVSAAGLAPGEVITISATPAWQPGPCKHNVAAEVDYGKRVDEGIETNNLRNETFDVKDSSGSSCPQTLVSISFPTYIAPLKFAICGNNLTPIYFWEIETFIDAVVSQSTSFTLQRLIVRYYTTTDASGLPVYEKEFDYAQFLKQNAGQNGFDTAILNSAITSTNGTLCQAPWAPEQVKSLKVILRGIDATNKSFETSNVINFQ